MLGNYLQSWAPPVLFRVFALASAKQKECESAKKNRKKQKRLARKKKAQILLPPTPEVRFQSPKMLGRGKGRFLNKMYSTVC
jgi:hypothetical protein